MSMTRQEQLDAVVRSYGEWYGDSKYAYTDMRGETAFTNAIVKSPQVSQFTRLEVEARKAELQNKPSWDDAPEGSKFLAQNDHGIWCFGTHDHAKPNMHGCWRGSRYGCWYEATQGEVIGDWRDTLEKRPETKLASGETLPEAISKTAEALGFESRGSAALANEGGKWNGEGLQQARVECEFLNDSKDWIWCVYIGQSVQHKKHVVETSDGKIHTVPEKTLFRPIKSDREKWMDQAIPAAKVNGNLAIVEALMRVYDAGLGKMPD